MALPEEYKVDFSAYRKSLVEAALEKMLSQHRDKCVMRQFVSALIECTQNLYGAAIDMQESRSLYGSSGVALDILGRIVGEGRGGLEYTQDGDEQYRTNIAMKALRNHAKVCSVPELLFIIRKILGIDVSLIGVGPNQVELVVPDTITDSQLRHLIDSTTSERVDESYRIPYPATMSFRSVVFLPDEWCQFDADGRGFDSAPLAAGSHPQALVPLAEINPPLPRSGYASMATLLFSVKGDGPLQFFCSLNGSDFELCESPKPIGGLTSGEQTFRVFARRNARNGPIAQHSWHVFPPDIVFSGLPGDSTSTEATIYFGAAYGVDVPVTFWGSLNGAPFEEVTSPHTMGGLSLGQQEFRIYAKSSVGIGGMSGHRWTVLA